MCDIVANQSRFASGIEQPPLACEELERAGDRSRLPRELLPRGRRRTVERTRGRLEKHPVSLLHDSQRDQHIVEQRVSGMGTNSARRMA